MERSTEQRPPHNVTPLLIGVLWLSIVGVSRAQRVVTVQQGPLYRTVGSHITIWCKVSGYQGPSEQNFQYSIYLPSAPEREVQIISTQDPSFSYAIFSQRVRSGDIYIERVTGDHSVLHIRQLQERDAGEYECHTPNTDPKFYGSYSAKVNLSVLPDSLLVTMPHQDLEKTEGSSLEGTCEVSKSSPQHTHLSVSWILTTDKDTDVLSLSRDFVLVPGESFAERFTSGDLRMDKLSDSSYRLSIMKLRVSDHGDLFCQGSEWIQDPDGTWTKITEKKSEKTTVKVSARQGEDFRVEIESATRSVHLLSPLDVTCSVSGPNPIGGRYQVIWLLDGAMMATWDSSGVSSFATKDSTRGAKGQMSVRRRDQKAWTLRINQAGEQDGGSYMCDVTEEESQRRRQSPPLTVTIETPGSAIRTVALRSEGSELYEGDSVKLLCQVSGFSASLDLTFLTLRPSGRWVPVASLRRLGEVEVAGEYAQRHTSGHLTAQRLSNGLHSLTLDHLVEGDGGPYSCLVTEWTQRPDETWRNETFTSDRVQINVQHLGSSLELVLMSRDQQVASGSPVRLFCRVLAGYSFREKLLSWSWDFQAIGGSFRSLVNVSGDGGLSWADSIPGLQGAAQLSIQGQTNTLTIYRAQRQHQGAYRCQVHVQGGDPSVPPAPAASTMNVIVRLPAARLSVGAADRVVSVAAGQEEAAVSCDIQAVTPGAALHVGWFSGSPSSAVNILNVTRDGRTSRHAAFSVFLSERVSPGTFILRILRPRLPSAFYCAVQELLQESGDWVRLAERTSGVTRLVARASDKTLKVPKENVSLAAPAGGAVVLPCPLEEVRSPAALYSVSWYYQAALLSYPSLLYRKGWEGVTEYKEGLAGRLQVVVAVRGNYSLILRSVGAEDAGIYHCQVQEWRLQDDRWRVEASDTSGYLQLRVTTPDDRLRVNLTALTLDAPEGSAIALPCQVLATSVAASVLSVTWWKVVAPGRRRLLVTASHLGQVEYPSEEGGRLQYERTSELTFQLRILTPHPPDTGIYYCRVQEWLQAPRGGWYQLGQQHGGNMSVTIQAAGLRSQVCSPRGLFFFLLVVSVLSLFLFLVLGWRLLRRWRNKAGGSSLRVGNGLWVSGKRSEMNVADRGEEIPGADETEQIQLRPTEDPGH